MFYPSFTQFKQLAKKGNLIPVYKEILADIETPVSAFLKITDGLKEKYAYLLESVEKGEKLGRYSFLSSSPLFVSQSRLEEIEKMLKQYQPVEFPGLPRFWGGAVGYLAYDYVRFLEELPERAVDDLNLPDCFFMFTDNLVIFDHVLQTIKVVSCVFLKDRRDIQKKYEEACEKIDRLIGKLKKPLQRVYAGRRKGVTALPFRSNFKRKDFLQAVKKTKEYIRAGEAIQVVISQRFAKKIDNSPFNIYRSLRTVNPSPYMFFLKFDHFYLIGSSPEILVRKEGNTAEVRPIAGTRPRGRNEVEDKKLERNLLESPKERAEHIMLVDLGRNDLGRVCAYETVKVPEKMTIEKYSHVMHIVSSVVGRLRRGENAFSLLKACFPAGTVTGAPKVRAMEIIEELEPVRRSTYAGAVGYFSFQGNMDMAITIRTILVKDGYAYVQSGAGIVADSSPEREYQETKNKAQALITAIEKAEQNLL